MTCAETVFEQFDQVDLAACFGEHVEVLVVDVDVTVDVSFCYIFWKNIVVYKVLGAFRTIFEHGAHGGVAVDIGILSLDVCILRVRICQLVIDVHQIRLCFSDLGMLSTIQDVGLGGLLIVVSDKHTLYNVLHLFYGACLSVELLDNLLGQVCEVNAGHLLAVYCFIGSIYSVEDLGLVELYFLSVSFDDRIHFSVLSFFSVCFLFFWFLILRTLHIVVSAFNNVNILLQILRFFFFDHNI